MINHQVLQKMTWYLQPSIRDRHQTLDLPLIHELIPCLCACETNVNLPCTTLYATDLRLFVVHKHNFALN